LERCAKVATNPAGVAWVAVAVLAVLVALAQWVVARQVLALWEAQAKAELINLAIWQVSLRPLLHRL
jgi:hypothetical protein